MKWIPSASNGNLNEVYTSYNAKLRVTEFDAVYGESRIDHGGRLETRL